MKIGTKVAVCHELKMPIHTQNAVPYKGYELLVESDGRKTTSCKVRLATVGVSRELGTITAAKEWVTKRNAQPMECREPFEALTEMNRIRPRGPRL